MILGEGCGTKSGVLIVSRNDILASDRSEDVVSKGAGISTDLSGDNSFPVCTKNLDSDVAVMETAQNRMWDDATSRLNRA